MWLCVLCVFEKKFYFLFLPRYGSLYFHVHSNHIPIDISLVHYHCVWRWILSDVPVCIQRIADCIIPMAHTVCQSLWEFRSHRNVISILSNSMQFAAVVSCSIERVQPKYIDRYFRVNGKETMKKTHPTKIWRTNETDTRNEHNVMWIN